MNTIGDRIKEIRKHTGMKQKELADFLDVTSKQLWLYETNVVIPPVEKGIKLCELYNCSFDYLYFGDDSRSYEKGFEDGYKKCKEDIKEFFK